ncbi:MAG TPA: ChbG/HpnK family deacetylase [Blastocatellia bacterium]
METTPQTPPLERALQAKDRYNELLVMKRLIVNADDFGFTRGVNAGILRAFREGILTSATMMANGDAFDDAVAVARANPDLAIGCHLAIVGGKSVARAQELNGLVDGMGHLPKTLSQLAVKLATGAARPKAIEREFAAQVEKIVAAGIKPTHFDAHKHAQLHPQVLKAMVRVAGDFGIKRIRNPFSRQDGHWRSIPRAERRAYLKQYSRSIAVMPARVFFKRTIVAHGIKTPDLFCGVAVTGLLNREALMKLLRAVPTGTTELMCHPGVYDQDLEAAHTRLKRSRQQELEALTDERVKRLANEIGIRFINFREMA